MISHLVRNLFGLQQLTKQINGMCEGVNFGRLRANLPRKMQLLSQKQANNNWNFRINL